MRFLKKWLSFLLIHGRPNLVEIEPYIIFSLEQIIQFK